MKMTNHQIEITAGTIAGTAFLLALPVGEGSAFWCSVSLIIIATLALITAVIASKL